MNWLKTCESQKKL